MKRLLAVVLLLLASSASADPLTSKERAMWDALTHRLTAAAEGVDGVVGLAVKDLKTGEVWSLHGSETFPTASSIKLAILYELYRRAEEGEIDLAQVATLGTKPVQGGGIVRFLGPQARLSWRDLAMLMMSLSDNEATNLLIDRLGRDRVNAALDGLGLPATRLRRRMMDLPAAQRGEENVATPLEMLKLIETIREGRGLSPERARDLRVLAGIEKDSAFRKMLPEGVVVLDKPGELEGVRCVAALVELPRRPYAAVVMTTYLRRDADGDALERTVSELLYGAFDRLDRAAETGRIISER